MRARAPATRVSLNENNFATSAQHKGVCVPSPSPPRGCNVAHMYTQRRTRAWRKTSGTSDRRCSDVRQFIYFRAREILLEYEIVTIPRYLELSSASLFLFSPFSHSLSLSLFYQKCVLLCALIRLPMGNLESPFQFYFEFCLEIGEKKKKKGRNP